MDKRELAKQVGHRFRIFRVAQSLRQKDTSAILDVSHSHISRLERGAMHKLDTAFLNLCRAEFGLSIDWLLTGQGAMVPAGSETTTAATESSRVKGRKKRSGHIPFTTDQKELRRKQDELSAAVARVKHLVQELFAHPL